MFDGARGRLGTSSPINLYECNGTCEQDAAHTATRQTADTSLSPLPWSCDGARGKGRLATQKHNGTRRATPMDWGEPDDRIALY